MTIAIDTLDPNLLEQAQKLKDTQLVRQQTIKIARATKYFKKKAEDAEKRECEKKPTATETEERAQQKTSLTRTLPAASKVVQAPLLRQLREDTESSDSEIVAFEPLALDPPELSTAILQTFGEVSRKLHAGDDLGSLKEEVVKMLYGLDERLAINEGILALLQSDRMSELVKAQARVTGYLISCSERSDLTPTESLGFFKLFSDEIASIRKSLTEVDRKPLKDVEGLLKKIDFDALQEEKKSQERFKNTTPQGREVMRRVAHSLLKVKARKEQEQLAAEAGKPEDTVHVAGDAPVVEQNTVQESGPASPPGGAGSPGIPREGEVRPAGHFVA